MSGFGLSRESISALSEGEFSNLLKDAFDCETYKDSLCYSFVTKQSEFLLLIGRCNSTVFIILSPLKISKTEKVMLKISSIQLCFCLLQAILMKIDLINVHFL